MITESSSGFLGASGLFGMFLGALVFGGYTDIIGRYVHR